MDLKSIFCIFFIFFIIIQEDLFLKPLTLVLFHIKPLYFLTIEQKLKTFKFPKSILKVLFFLIIVSGIRIFDLKLTAYSTLSYDYVC